jgi:Pyruvate/2-oxoacid:ferredoxin oxidoreductase delta subunit
MMTSARLLTIVRVLSGCFAAIPAVGLGLLALIEGVIEPGGMSLNRAFHLSLGLCLLVLFSEFAVSMSRSGTIGGILGLGVGGFAVGLSGAILGELFGPPALLALVGTAGVWAVVLARTAKPPGDRAAAVALPASASHLSLHYFTGTGNTYRVASWIADAARARGVAVDLRPITSHDEAERPAVPASGRRLLVLTPTHGFTAPWPVLVHALRTPGVRGADVFVVATRAGWYVGPLLLPGLEGTASWLLALVLVLRGGRLVGVTAIDMPSNWTALHWGMSDSHIATIVGRAGIKTSAFAEKILDGRRPLTGWISLATGVLLLPASLGYVLFARRVLGKLFFADERCTSCGLCVKHCPLDAVRMAGAAPQKPYWSFRCESCMRCMNVCPENAIQASWLGAVVLTYAMLAANGLTLALLAASGKSIAELAASAASFLAAAAVAGPVYGCVWWLGRSRSFAWLRGHLTPTRVYRRYREPGTDLRKV